MKKTQAKAKQTAKTRRGKKEQENGNFADLGHELMGLVKNAKDKFEGLDDRKKKAVIAGVAGAITLIAGAIEHKRKKK